MISGYKGGVSGMSAVATAPRKLNASTTCSDSQDPAGAMETPDVSVTNHHSLTQGKFKYLLVKKIIIRLLT